MRRTPFKRTRPMRRGKGRTKYARRERDVDYMLRVKTLPCVARHLGPCDGVVEADHAGPRGIGQKADDTTTIPICTGHHRDRTDFSGAFKHWNQAMMREFLSSSIDATRYALGLS